MQPFYDDREGDAELDASTQHLTDHLTGAFDHLREAVDFDGPEQTADQRVHSLGSALSDGAEAFDNLGNGLSESWEKSFEGDGTVGGELVEAGMAIAGETVERSLEVSGAFVSGFLDLGADIVHGVADGVQDLSLGWDTLQTGDVVGAGTHVTEAAKDIGEGIVAGMEAGYEGIAGGVVEAVEGSLSTAAEALEGAFEVGSAIADDEPEEQEEPE